ncbi:hypothetical protein FB45DRAFT_794218 [Roridomyces roridus]|uniref:Uncharacterized protein n=1 Tax=Roridomyces roridus TaxID=1738132 RepID=A0AAD7BQV3_9AGAR|nr:hypothetical protein FB45DRAFT_794218 [Roridomyces roridus]
MRGCPELGRLPKAQALISSLHFRNQTPGTAPHHVFAKKLHNRESRLDPTHPVEYAPGKQQPILTATGTTAFTLRAIPMGLLTKPIAPIRPLEPFDTWDARVARGAPSGTVAAMALHDPRPNRLSMSLQFSTVSGFYTHQRVQVLRRFKTAVSHIVIRNADVQQLGGQKRLVFREEGAKPEEWILQGWTYHVRPTLELYRMPYPDLVGILRPMLRDIWTRGMKLEEQWTAASFSKLKPTVPELPPIKTPKQRSSAESSPEPRNDVQKESPGLASARPIPSKRRKGVASVASLPPIPDFDPFPFTPVPPAPTLSPPALPPQTKSKSSKPVNWWAVGRVLEAAVADGDFQGPTRWNPSPRAAPPPAQDSVPTQTTSPAAEPSPDSNRATVQAKLAGMLFRPQSVIRPDQKERAAGKIPRRMHQFEDN